MNFITKTAVAYALVPFALSAALTSEATSKGRMLDTLDIIANTFEVTYAPAEWKKQHWGWDLHQHVDIAKHKVNQAPHMSVKEFQCVVRDFLLSPKDYHVSVQFFSTEAATLPFQVKSIGGRYFFCYINRNKLSEQSFPFYEGDELVSFDGHPTQDAVHQLIKENFRQAVPDTDNALAEKMLTMRLGMLGYSVPQGSVPLVIRSAKTGMKHKYQMTWNYYPEKIQNKAVSVPVQKALTVESCINTLLKDISMVSFEAQALADFNKKMGEAGNPHEIGSRTGFLPPLGEVVWRAPDYMYYDAYIYIAEDDRRIGYLRISDYMAGELDLDLLTGIIAKFEEETDAVVIDQLNNPGGSVFTLYTICSLFAKEPLAIPKHRFAITQDNVMMSLYMIEILESLNSEEEARFVFGDTCGGLPVDNQLIQGFLHYFRFIVDEWNAGHTITDLGSLCGIDFINPYPSIHYTKPVLVLINGLDFSCGDLLPAIFQDSGRGHLFGTRTAGAGGCVEAHAFPNQFGIAAYRYTMTIAQRANGKPIEDLGVTPDIEHKLTEKDLHNNYSDYIKSVNAILKNIK